MVQQLLLLCSYLHLQCVCGAQEQGLGVDCKLNNLFVWSSQTRRNISLHSSLVRLFIYHLFTYLKIYYISGPSICELSTQDLSKLNYTAPIDVQQIISVGFKVQWEKKHVYVMLCASRRFC